MSILPMDLATYYGVDDIHAAISIDDNLHCLLVISHRLAGSATSDDGCLI